MGGGGGGGGGSLHHLINLKMYRLTDRQISSLATPMMGVKTSVRRRKKGFGSVLDRRASEIKKALTTPEREREGG